MKLIPFLHHRTVTEEEVMEHEFNVPEAIPIAVSRILSNNFTGIIILPTQILCTNQNK